MHTLQSKHTKLKTEEVEKLLLRLNISLSQLPKISKNDITIPENCKKGDVVKIERSETEDYYRVII